MGFFSWLFGGKKSVPANDDDGFPARTGAPTTRKFNLSTGHVAGEPLGESKSLLTETQIIVPGPDGIAALAALDAAPPPPEGDVIPFDDALPPALEDLPPVDAPGVPASALPKVSGDTSRRKAPVSAAPAGELAGVASPSLRAAASGLSSGTTARMVATGRATPQEAAETKTAASPSLRAVAAGTTVSHKRRVSARNKTLGALLVSDGLVTEDDVEHALQHQSRHGGLLGQILVAKGKCQPEAVAEALKRQRTITTVMLKGTVIDYDLPKILSKDFCIKHRLLPFERFGNVLCLAMSNVLDTQAKNLVRERSNMTLKPFDAEWGDLSDAIANAFLPPGAAAQAAQAARRALSATTRVESGAVSAALKVAATVGATGEMRIVPLPEGRLAAIPISRAFAEEVVLWDVADPERRWMATQLADNPLPLLPHFG